MLPLNGSKITKRWSTLASSKPILLTKKKCHINKTLKIGNKTIKASSSMKLVGSQVDDQLNFNLYIFNICISASNQLNALIRLKCFLAFEEKKTLIVTSTLISTIVPWSRCSLV